MPSSVEGGAASLHQRVRLHLLRGISLSPDAPAPEYTLALVASLPITNISVVKAEDSSHKGTLEKVREMLEWEGGFRDG